MHIFSSHLSGDHGLDLGDCTWGTEVNPGICEGIGTKWPQWLMTKCLVQGLANVFVMVQSWSPLLPVTSQPLATSLLLDWYLLLGLIFLWLHLMHSLDLTLSVSIFPTGLLQCAILTQLLVPPSTPESDRLYISNIHAWCLSGPLAWSKQQDHTVALSCLLPQ